LGIPRTGPEHDTGVRGDTRAPTDGHLGIHPHVLFVLQSRWDGPTDPQRKR
jgi:hypothetical protein